jgi:hypothetical protein
MTRHRGARWGALLLVLCAGVLQRPAAADDWSWLQGTIWYVPEQNLPAIEFDPSSGTHTVISDQTVYTIDRYVGGYFWGRTAVQLGGTDEIVTRRPVCLSLVGSVTPEGAVSLSFTRASSSQRSRTGFGQATLGIGQMRMHDGGWSMENQMSTGTHQQVTHWAYMVQCHPEDPCMRRLPGLDISLPQLIQECD